MKGRKLAQLKIGEKATIVSIEGNDVISRRLMEMGVIPGVEVKLIKKAPFGCPLQISVNGSHLAIRTSEAETIEVLS